MRSQKLFYAVANGDCEPTIFSSWPKTQAVTSGFPKAKFKGFMTLEDATEFLHQNNCFKFLHDLDSIDWAGLPPKTGDCTYGVANGRKGGVYHAYTTEAELQVSGFSHACHKGFGNIAAAEKANREGKIMQDTVGLRREVRSMMNIMNN